MIRQTSIDVYHQIESEGLLTKLKLQVFKIIVFNDPITSGETWKYHLPHLQRQSLTPRFIELERMGVIRPALERPCRYTGRIVIAWEVTGKLPAKYEKKSVGDKAKIKELEAQIEMLQKEIVRTRKLRK